MEFIERESKGVVQNAADALQKSIIRGIASNNRDMVIVNLPYVGSYPRLFNKAVFPSTIDSIYGVALYGQEFPLYRFVKSIFRLKNALRGLRSVSEENLPSITNRRPVVLVYAAHLPFMLAAIAYRGFRRKAAVCLIMPDLPQFMAEGGRLYRAAKAVETAIFNRLTKHIDYFVVLTKAMAEKLELPEHKYVVVEGVANEFAAPALTSTASAKRVFMYAGTLAGRYGIVDLLTAFQKVSTPSAELWICGEGDSRDKVEAAARADHRIKFLGQLPRDEVLKLQFQASVLVNPRGPGGEFTKYSFPSKTMEYMASGRTVLMHRLPGIPEEYHQYFVSPEDPWWSPLAT
ncbi:MAG: glycosyltransferase [Mesorhizobium sp.]